MPDPTDKQIWDELKQREAEARDPAGVPVHDIELLAGFAPQAFRLWAGGESPVMYTRQDIHERDLHAAYQTGKKDEALYQAEKQKAAILSAIRAERLYQEGRLERRRLAIGAALFFGFCAGLLVAAGMNWLLR